MKAISFEAFGPPTVLKVINAPDPSPGPHDVLVRIEAAGVCHHDVMHRAGRIPGAKPAVILGHETAGRIEAIGAAVTVHRVGDPVIVYQRAFCGECRHCLRGRMDLCAMLGKPAVDTAGSYAEFVKVPATQAIGIPAEMPFESAALACCPIGTSVRALRAVAGINPGDTVLVTGASGGLGMHQLQLVRALGGRSIAVTTDATKTHDLRQAGADEVVLAVNGAFSKPVWEATARRGVDIVIENVGQTLAESLRTLAPNGIAVVLGNIGVDAVPVLPGLLIGRRLRIAGSGMATHEDIRQAIALIASGAVRPIIDRVLPFTAAAEAHALVESRALRGRVVLRGW
jgi:acryloyl-coenzyme A reductase